MKPYRTAFRVWLLALSIALSATSLVGQSELHAVSRVVDGDTVVLATVGTVRLIGVDTPETVDPRKPVQHFGQEASAFLRSMLAGQSVRLEYDQQRLDKYQRTLAFLYLSDGTFVNLEIVRQGYGHAYLTYPFGRMDAFRDAEREAREARRGLWADPPTTEQAPADAPQSGRVWVNTSSKVYHCPGTRYYGNTARGEYLAESDALSRGNRPAYGRSCGSTARPPSASGASPSPVRAPAAAAAVTSSDTRVWVNTSSHVYHCPGTRYYGTTKNGTYMGQQDALAAGNRPAAGRSCS